MRIARWRRQQHLKIIREEYSSKLIDNFGVRAMPIHSTMSADGNELTITVQGRFDFSALQQFRGAYEKVNLNPKSYVIDLKESDYLDSSALGMLLALRDHAGGDNANIKITNANTDVKKILVITKLDELFKME
jgi:anti-anti-sigma factor